MHAAQRAPSLSRSFCTCRPLLVSPRPKPTTASPKPSPRYIKPRALSPTGPQTGLFVSTASIPAIVHRPMLINEEAAGDLVRAWGLDKMHDVTVVEAYAGPGGLTKAMLDLKNVKRVISIEEAFRYQPMLQELHESLKDKSRLEVVQADPFSWETYSILEEGGSLAHIPKAPWDQVHPNLFLACQSPNTRHGEQLFYQFLAASATKMWLYQYGRFESGFLGPDAFWDKVTAAPGATAHHKLAVLVPALGELKRIQTLSAFSPADHYFHRPRGDPAAYSPLKVTPYAKAPVDNFDALEFVTRNMFAAKSQPWQKAVANLATGATNLIPKMVAAGLTQEPIIVNKLALADWVIIANVFNDWPFRPQTLFDDLSWAPEP